MGIDLRRTAVGSEDNWQATETPPSPPSQELGQGLHSFYGVL